MSSIFPIRPPTSNPHGNTCLVSINDEAADEVFSALNSSTAREILAALYENPQTASEISEVIDSSIQNSKYHLNKLLDADLIEVVDTGYSESGREMKIYSPCNNSLVLVASDKPTRRSIGELIRSILGAVGILALGSLVINQAVQRIFLSYPKNQVLEIGNPTVEPISQWTQTALPGISFFAGGLFAFFMIIVWHYRVGSEVN